MRVWLSKMQVFSFYCYIFHMKFPTGFTYRSLHGFARFPGDSTALVLSFASWLPMYSWPFHDVPELSAVLAKILTDILLLLQLHVYVLLCIQLLQCDDCWLWWLICGCCSWVKEFGGRNGLNAILQSLNFCYDRSVHCCYRWPTCIIVNHSNYFGFLQLAFVSKLLILCGWT